MRSSTAFRILVGLGVLLVFLSLAGGRYGLALLACGAALFAAMMGKAAREREKDEARFLGAVRELERRAEAIRAHVEFNAAVSRAADERHCS